MSRINRRTVFPVVGGVLLVTLIVAFYSVVILGRFFYWYDGSHIKEEDMAGIARMLRHYYWMSSIVGLGLFGFGAHLLRPESTRLSALLYYVAGAAIAITAWIVWITLCDREMIILRLPAA